MKKSRRTTTEKIHFAGHFVASFALAFLLECSLRKCETVIVRLVFGVKFNILFAIVGRCAAKVTAKTELCPCTRFPRMRPCGVNGCAEWVVWSMELLSLTNYLNPPSTIASDRQPILVDWYHTAHGLCYERGGVSHGADSGKLWLTRGSEQHRALVKVNLFVWPKIRMWNSKCAANWETNFPTD